MRKTTKESLRTVFSLLKSGKSLASSLIEGFKDNPKGNKMIRLLLLGYNSKTAVQSLETENEEDALLCSLIINVRRIDTLTLGIEGSKLVELFEKRSNAREARKNMLRTLSFRSYILSSVLGCVMATISAVGPLIASFSLTGRANLNPLVIELSSLIMCIFSSAMIGFFFNGRKFFVNTIISSILFFLVYNAISSLIDYSQLLGWTLYNQP